MKKSELHRIIREEIEKFEPYKGGAGPSQSQADKNTRKLKENKKYNLDDYNNDLDKMIKICKDYIKEFHGKSF